MVEILAKADDADLLGMISLASNPWAGGWSEGHAPAKDESAAEWCAEHVHLADSPMGEKYQLGSITDDPLNDLQDPEIFESCTVGHTGFGKSAVLECASCYIVKVQPGPTTVYGQTNETTKEWMGTRLKKAFENCKPVAALLPKGAKRHSNKTGAVIFDHMAYLSGGANLTNTQEKSMRYVLGDEVWAWEPGILGEALKRHHDRWNRKGLFVAQGGVEGDDWHKFSSGGRGLDAGFCCPSCGTEQKYKWEQVKYENKTDRNGDPDWVAIEPTVRYECENGECGETFADNARGRNLRHEHRRYIPRNNSHVPTRITRYIPAMANPRIRLYSLVQEWIEAIAAAKKGDDTKLRQFIQKRLAQFWEVKSDAPTLNRDGDPYTLAEYNDGQKWDQEHGRQMRVDVQKQGFWVSMRAWSIGNGTRSRLLYAGFVDTWQTLFYLREKFGIENHHVLIDGRYRIDEVVRQIHKHCGQNLNHHWTILLGQDNTKGYAFEVGTKQHAKKVWRIYSAWQYGKTSDGLNYRTLSFSNLRAKDALAAQMELSGGIFGTPTDASKDYIEQMQSEKPKEVKPGLWRWEKIKDHTPNHLWDTEVQGMVGASLAGWLQLETVD